MKLPDPTEFSTIEAYQNAMQKFYQERATFRMRDQIPTLRMSYDGEWDYKDNKFIPLAQTRGYLKPPGDDLALVQMIKEDLKEARLLGWKIDEIQMDSNLRAWLMDHRPAGLAGNRLFGIALTGGCFDPDQPYHMIGSHPTDGVCFTCRQNERDDK